MALGKDLYNKGKKVFLVLKTAGASCIQNTFW
jgi:hypothetical protein